MVNGCIDSIIQCVGTKNNNSMITIQERVMKVCLGESIGTYIDLGKLQLMED